MSCRPPAGMAAAHLGRCAWSQAVVAPYPYCLHCKARAAHPDGASWYKVRGAPPARSPPRCSLARGPQPVRPQSVT